MSPEIWVNIGLAVIAVLCGLVAWFEKTNRDEHKDLRRQSDELNKKLDGEVKSFSEHLGAQDELLSSLTTKAVHHADNHKDILVRMDRGSNAMNSIESDIKNLIGTVSRIEGKLFQ